MARSYTNRATAIWRETNFRALTADEQHALFLIESQPDISAAGTLPLTLKRWASLFHGGTVDGLRRSLAGLERAGRVVVDEDTEELLVCSFVADDRSYGNPKRRPVILRAGAEVVSLPIRRALAEEFRRVGLPTEVLALPPNPGGPPPSGRDCLSDSQSDGRSQGPDGTADQDQTEAAEPGTTDPSPQSGPPQEKPQVDSQSDSHPDRHTQFDGDVVCKGPYVVASTHNPHLSSRSPAPSAPPGIASFVANALGTTDDETREVIDQIRRLHKPRNLTGYVRTMADNGDLQPILDDVRRAKARKAEADQRREQRAAPPDPAVEPPEAAATPEEAAAARAAIRQFLSGRKPGRGGDPASLGAMLGKAASA